MTKGKKLCNYLRDVRKEIADANEIDYNPTPCTHEGDCMGTCPKCEAEVRHIENGLRLRRLAGKAITIVGLSVAMASCSGCNDGTTDTAGMVEDPDSIEMQVMGDVDMAPDSALQAELDSIERVNGGKADNANCLADKKSDAPKEK